MRSNPASAGVASFTFETTGTALAFELLEEFRPRSNVSRIEPELVGAGAVLSVFAGVALVTPGPTRPFRAFRSYR